MGLGVGSQVMPDAAGLDASMKAFAADKVVSSSLEQPWYLGSLRDAPEGHISAITEVVELVESGFAEDDLRP